MFGRFLFYLIINGGLGRVPRFRFLGNRQQAKV